MWNIQKYLHIYQTFTGLILRFVCIFMQLWYLVASGYVNCKSVSLLCLSLLWKEEFAVCQEMLIKYSISLQSFKLNFKNRELSV